jgi:hypothetical protein
MTSFVSTAVKSLVEVLRLKKMFVKLAMKKENVKNPVMINARRFKIGSFG